MSLRSFVGVALTCVVAASVASLAWAAPGATPAAHVSVPSVAPVGKAVALTGGGFTPGGVVTLRIIGPGKRTEMAAVVIGADGSITHSMVPAGPGTYRIVVIDAAGKALANELRLIASN